MMNSPPPPSSTASSEMNNEDKLPLWKFVEKIAKINSGGGTWNFKCSFCQDDTLKGSYTRVRAHLLGISGKGIRGCKRVTEKDKLEMHTIEEEFGKELQAKALKNVPLPCGSSATTSPVFSLETGTSLKKRKSDQKTIPESFDENARDQLDCEIARMFYTSGWPFNLARNPYYQSSYTFAANRNLGGYVPPSYNKLRTTLLENEKKNVDSLILPLKSLWPKRGEYCY